jgi:hypothetical protein
MGEVARICDDIVANQRRYAQVCSDRGVPW